MVLLFRQAVKEFLEYLEIERGRTPSTVAHYAFYLKRFDEWAHNPVVENITVDLVRRYRLHLNRAFAGRSGPSLKKSTQNHHLIALRSFLKYLAKRDILTLSPEKIELAKQDARHVAFLEDDELARMRACAKRKSGTVGARNFAILEMLFSTGLRVSELAALCLDGMNVKRDSLTVKGKGGKYRIVFVSPAAKAALATYIALRRDTSPCLFVREDRAKRGEAMALTSRSIQRIIDDIARASGVLKHVTPHTLRHTFATDLLRNGADIRSVQSLLGHASIMTTQVYTHVTDKTLEEAHTRFHDKK